MIVREDGCQRIESCKLHFSGLYLSQAVTALVLARVQLDTFANNECLHNFIEIVNTKKAPLPDQQHTWLKELSGSGNSAQVAMASFCLGVQEMLSTKPARHVALSALCAIRHQARTVAHSVPFLHYKTAIKDYVRVQIVTTQLER